MRCVELYSKFLYHSVDQDGGDSVVFDEVGTPAQDLPLSHTPAASSNAQAAAATQNFHRTFHWKFRDTTMLLGSNLLVFSGAGHPSVSLKLHRIDEAITNATSLDYWLDNVMANVPELCICYHKEGFVQGYQLVQTEAIPSLAKPGFHPEVVNECAQSVLSFLRENCTREGGTYWLLKGKCG